jgi:hypothetical protein
MVCMRVNFSASKCSQMTLMLTLAWTCPISRANLLMVLAMHEASTAFAPLFSPPLSYQSLSILENVKVQV